MARLEAALWLLQVAVRHPLLDQIELLLRHAARLADTAFARGRSVGRWHDAARIGAGDARDDAVVDRHAQRADAGGRRIRDIYVACTVARHEQVGHVVTARSAALGL